MRVATLLIGVAFLLPARAGEVDAFADAAIARANIPACAVSVVHDGRVVHASGHGIENLESGVRANADTYFEIGSITKTFTAQAVLLLAEDGKLALDDRLDRHLGALPEAWRALTLRQLLTHTSGLKDWEAAQLLDFRREYTDAEFDSLMGAFALDFAPGERWNYSNTGYILLGRVVAQAAGEPYDAFVRERIFAKLAMDASRFSRPQDVVPHRAGGYVDGEGGFRKGMLLRPRIVEPNGGILTTVNELAKWARAFAPGVLLSRESLAAMATPVALTGGGSFPSGFGLFASAFRGHRLWVNNGTTPGGYSSVFYHYPDDALTVFVLCNADRGDAVNRIATRVASFFVPGLDVRALATIDDPAPRETKALFRALRAYAAGRADARVAAALHLSDDARSRLAAQLANDARMLRLEPDPDDATTVRYRVEGGGRRWWYTLALDGERRIVDLRFEGE